MKTSKGGEIMKRLTQINGNNEVYCIVDNKKIVVENIDMLKICQRLKLYEDLEEEFEYEIIKSKRKTGCIEIKPDGRVLVRVPNRTSQSQIDDMLAKKHDWILKHLSEIKKISLSKESEEKLSEQDIKRLKRKAAQYLPERCPADAGAGGSPGRLFGYGQAGAGAALGGKEVF